jgi:hypothetical protein
MSVRSPSARMVGSASSDSRHCATKRLGEAKALKLAHACDHRRPSVSLRGLIGSRPQVDDAIMPCGLGGKRAIKLGPAVRLDLGVQTAMDFKVGSQPELLGDQVSGSGAHPVADVVTRNHEISAIVGLAAHDDMDMGILGIPVIDSDPVELRTEISLGVSHQVPRERLQIGEPVCVVRGHDEPEVVAIALAPIGECAVIGVVVLGVEHPARGAVFRHAVAAEIDEVGAERGPPHPVPYDARLDHGATGPIGQSTHGGEARGAAAAEGTAATAST